MRARLLPYGPTRALPWSSVSSSIMKCVSLQQLVLGQPKAFFLSFPIYFHQPKIE